jgi:hypothetical protein
MLNSHKFLMKIKQLWPCKSFLHSFTHDVFEQGRELGTVSRTRTHTAATTSALGLFTTKDDASPIEITGLLTLYQAPNEKGNRSPCVLSGNASSHARGDSKGQYSSPIP